MKKVLLPLILMVIIAPVVINAQSAGTFVGSLGLGVTGAQGDFASSSFENSAGNIMDGQDAGSGFGIEAELRYYLLGGLSFGGFINKVRFGSTFESYQGRVSYDFTQIGGLAKMNFISFENGKLYLTGGGGLFTPNVHYYVPDNPSNVLAEDRGFFAFGGFGLMSKSDRKLIYEFEMRYNIASADLAYEETEVENWNFIYAGIKISFASKGKPAPPKY